MTETKATRVREICMENEIETEHTIETVDLPPEALLDQPPAPPVKKMVSVSTDTFAKIREEEKKRTEKAANDSLEARAKSLGFANAEEMFTAAESTRRPAPKGDDTVTKPATQSKPSPKPVPRVPVAPTRPAASASTIDRKAERWKAEKERLQRVNATEARKRKDAERTSDALRAEISLREVAIRAGVVDVDYALTLVKRELAGKTQEELKTFDEVKFFEGLRTSKPVLFSVELRPAHTGSTATPPPAPPKAPEIVRQDPENKPIDARQMTREQYKAHLAKRGIHA